MIAGMIWRIRHWIGLTTLCVGLFARVAHATLLNPGGTVVPGPTSIAGAVLVVDSGPQPFASVDGTSFGGSLRTRVYVNDPSNPFGPSLFTFTFQISNDGPDALERFVCVRNQGILTDVCVIAAPGEAIPSSADRSTNAAVIGWDYSGTTGIPDAGRSALLVMHTNAGTYYPRIDYLINGSVATVNSFGPGPLTEPEPSGALVAVCGMIASLTRLRLRPPR